MSGPVCTSGGGPTMRRWAAAVLPVTVLAALMVTTAASADAGASGSPAPEAVHLRGQTGIFADGTFCETDTFAPDGTFSGTTDDSAPVGGNDTVTAATGRGRQHLTMTWTTGPAAGAVFQGRFHKEAKPKQYAGTYSHAGSSVVATLGPTSGRGCPTATAAPVSPSIVLGATDADTVTVTGTGGATPTGIVNFSVCPGDAVPCDQNSASAVSLGSPAVSGSGDTAAATSPAFTPKTTGSYCFWADFSGGAQYLSLVEASTTDQCFSVGPAPPPRPPIGIVALNKVGPHEILGGGTGQFVVAGDIVLNTDVSHQQWTGSAVDPATQVPWAWDDAIDAKTGSNIYVYGTIHSSNATYNGQSLWPLDSCFQPNILGDGNPLTPSPAYQTGDPATELPAVQMNCQEHGGSVNVDYDNIDPTNVQINDPLSATGAPPNPLSASTDIACPGSTLQTDPAMTVDSNGTTQLTPGEYTTPVEITGSANFQDCPGGDTGIYRFDQGLWVDPQTAGQTVTGSNVVIATENPYPVAGNVPGSIVGGSFVASGAGNGAPCLPSTTMTSGPSGDGTPMRETSGNVCGGTNPATDGVVAYGDSTFSPDPAETGTGDNFSLIVGGVPGTAVTVTGPTSGPYGGADGNPGLVLYQDPGTQANDGFDAEAGDGAAITVNGVIYNASLSDYGANAPLDYWDGAGGGIPFYAGGTLQAGFGAGWSDGPAQSSGSVDLNGTSVVDDYNTDGATTMTIIGQPYSLPGTTSGTLASHSRPGRSVKSSRHGAGHRRRVH